MVTLSGHDDSLINNSYLFEWNRVESCCSQWTMLMGAHYADHLRTVKSASSSLSTCRNTDFVELQELVT